MSILVAIKRGHGYLRLDVNRVGVLLGVIVQVLVTGMLLRKSAPGSRYLNVNVACGGSASVQAKGMEEFGPTLDNRGRSWYAYKQSVEGRRPVGGAVLPRPRDPSLYLLLGCVEGKDRGRGLGRDRANGSGSAFAGFRALPEERIERA
jgi:hypothetical protein